MTIEELLKQQQPRRKVQGIAAALLPYEPDGQVAVDALAQQLTVISSRADECCQYDTGYVNYLNDAEKEEMLSWTRQTLGNGVPFVAGTYIENQASADTVLLYRRQIDSIVRYGGIPILFQTARLHRRTPADGWGFYSSERRFSMRESDSNDFTRSSSLMHRRTANRTTNSFRVQGNTHELPGVIVTPGLDFQGINAGAMWKGDNRSIALRKLRGASFQQRKRMSIRKRTKGNHPFGLENGRNANMPH